MICAYTNLSSVAILYSITPVKLALCWLTTKDRLQDDWHSPATADKDALFPLLVEL
jgi:hypothetical protein